jgi:hypothetical protein
MFRFFHENITTWNLGALGKQDKVQKENDIYPFCVLEAFSPPQLAFKQAACVQERTGFQVIVAAIHLHFDVGLLTIVKGDVDVKAENLSQEEGREYFGILQPEIPNLAVDAAGEQQPEGFPGILVFAREKCFENEVTCRAEGFSQRGIFPGQTFNFPIGAGERE